MLVVLSIIVYLFVGCITYILFCRNQVLKQSSGIEEQGNIVWQLALILLLAWTLVYLCLWKGVEWTGKVIILAIKVPP